jgi:hypothetical protein
VLRLGETLFCPRHWYAGAHMQSVEQAVSWAMQLMAMHAKQAGRPPSTGPESGTAAHTAASIGPEPASVTDLPSSPATGEFVFELHAPANASAKTRPKAQRDRYVIRPS